LKYFFLFLEEVKMGGSQSKKASASPVVDQKPVGPDGETTNFDKKQSQEVADGVHVGNFLLERSLLQAKDQHIKNQETKIQSYIHDKVSDSQMQAAEMLENYRKVAVEELGTKDEQITNLQNKMIEMGEAFENYKIAANASIKEVTETCEQKVQEQKNQIEANNKQVQESYNQAFVEQDAKFVLREYSPVCQDKVFEIRECYAANKGQSLKCSKIVADLQNCVDEIKKDRLG
jgi:hypothetical protein